MKVGRNIVNGAKRLLWGLQGWIASKADKFLCKHFMDMPCTVFSTVREENTAVLQINKCTYYLIDSKTIIAFWANLNKFDVIIYDYISAGLFLSSSSRRFMNAVCTLLKC